MQHVFQQIDDINNNCNEILDYLDEVNKTNNKNEIHYFTYRVAECLEKIKNSINVIQLSMMSDKDRIYLLNKNIEQLSLEFDDIE